MERQLECRQGIKLGKVSAVPLWQRSGPRLTSLVDSTDFPEHEDDCMEAYPLGLMDMACGLLNLVQVTNIIGL